MGTDQSVSVHVNDEEKIRAAALDYIAGVLEADPTRMERCLHPELAKRAYLPGIDGKPQLSHMSAMNLILDAHTWKVIPDRHAEVVILDRYEGAASVRTTFDNWIDYMHIVKVADEWEDHQRALGTHSRVLGESH
jgi:hypothetical protein